MKQTNVYFAMWLWLSVFGMVAHTQFNTHTYAHTHWLKSSLLSWFRWIETCFVSIYSKAMMYLGWTLSCSTEMDVFFWQWHQNTGQYDDIVCINDKIRKQTNIFMTECLTIGHIWKWPKYIDFMLFTQCVSRVWVFFLAHLDAVVRGKPC